MTDQPAPIIRPGFPENQRAAAATLFFDAFAGKLDPILGDDGRGTRLIARLIEPDATIAAYSPDGTRLLGLAGLKTRAGSFMHGTLSDMAAEYGLFGGLWRGLALTLLDQKPEPGCLHIDALAVSPEARGQGIGSRLLNACRTEARRLGFKALSLDVVDTNPRAHALYERYGFRDARRVRIWPLHRLFGFTSATRMVRPI